MSLRALRACMRCRRWIGPSRCRRHACMASGSASACTLTLATPRSAVAHPTRRRESEFPCRGEACCRLFCGRVNAVACTEGVCALPSVGRSLTARHRHACLMSAPASASACVRACLPARAQCRHGRWWLLKHRERRVSCPPYRGKACCRVFCAAVNVVACTEGVHALRSVG